MDGCDRGLCWHCRGLIRIVSLIVLLAGVLTGNPALAQTSGHPLINSRFHIGIGGFFPTVSSKIRLDSDLGLGTELDLEAQLGIEKSKNVVWANGRWNISRRNHLEFEWVQLNRSGSVAGITRPYEIGETVIQAGGQIDSVLDISLYRATYGFSLIRDERKDLQLQAGVHVADIEASLRLTGLLSINGSVFQQTVQGEGGDIVAPLPHFGANFAYAFTDKLALYANVLGFALSVGNFKGSILETGGTLQYNFTRHLGLGAGVRFFRVDVEARDSGLTGEFMLDYLGPVVYASAEF